MKNNYFLHWTQRLFFLLIIITGLNTNAQSFLITFPDHATAPTQNPRNLSVCNSTSLLKVRMDVAAKSTSGATVSIQLPPGVEYIANSVTKVGGTTLLTISDNGGGANAPNFIIGPNDLLTGQFIEFTIDRRATCPSRTASIAGTIFSDAVTGTIPGNSASTAISSAYQLFYPVFSFTQPVTQTNAVVGSTYTRNFTISNGGNGCATTVYFTIDNPANGSQTTSVTLGGVTIAPTSTVGTTSNYTVTAANLPGGDFCFGETLTFTETYIVNACNAVTNYAAGWGCGTTPASWCQTVNGTGDVAMATGVPNIGLAFTRVSAGDFCIGDTWRYTYTNNGSENTSGAGTAFNINALLGTGAWGTATNAIQAGGGSYLTNFTINGVSINFNPRTTGQGWTLDLSQLASDPDGIGGLTDADGDGQFDDLPLGASLVITYQLLWDNTGTLFNQTCATDSAYDVTPNARINYTNQCGASLFNYNTTPISTLRYMTTSGDGTITNNPSDIVNGTPFTTVFNYNVIENVFPGLAADQRIELRFTLPAGLSLASLNGFYQLNSGALQPVTAVQTGNDVIVTFLNTNASTILQKFFFDFITSCPTTSIEMPYRFVQYSVTCPSYEVIKECGTFKINNHCPCDLSLTGGGVDSEIATAQRTTLGWTDNTLTTHVTPASLPAKSLKRLLRNDEARIQQNGTQLAGGSFDNLWVEASFGRSSLALPYVTILNTSSVTITDASTGNIYVCPLPAAATSNITASLETHTYNLGTLIGSILPSGFMFEPGDTYQLNMNIKYTGGSTPGNNETLLVTHTQLYNKDLSNNTMGCGGSGVELYIIPFRSIGVQLFSQTSLGTGCLGGNLLGSYNQSIGTENEPFPNEFRPIAYFDEMQFTLPVGFSYDTSRTTTISGMNDGGATSSVSLPSPTISGQVITFTNDGTWRLFDQGTNSSSSMSFNVPIIANCAAISGNNTIPSLSIKLRQFYYSYPNAPAVPTIPNLVDFPQTTINSVAFISSYNSKPATSLSNQSGTIQASRPTESFTVRVASTGASAANNIWIAIQNNPNVTITNVVDIATNTSLLGTTYSNGKWYQVISSLAPSATRDVRIDFTYTTCVADAITVFSGWDCAGYPTSPDSYLCTPSTVILPFIPQTAEVQIITVTQPTAPVDLCTPIPFEYHMNSAGAGNTIDNTFVVDLPAGMSYAGALEAEYPVGSGNWAAVSFTTAGTQTTVDLTTHPNFPVQGLPGTLTDLGDSNSRLIGFRFSLNTNCDFVAGSNINIFARANRSCGVPATGNGIRTSSLDVNIDGVFVNYLIDSNITPKSGSFSNCNSPVVFGVTQTAVSPLPIGSTASTQIIIPEGYEYVVGSFVCNDPDTSSAAAYTCPTYLGTFTNGAGQDYIELSIPAGSISGDKFDFDFTIQKTGVVACGDYSLLLQTVDKVASVACPSAPGGVCNNFTIQTGSTTYDYTVSNPVLDITGLSASISTGSLSGIITIANTSAINQTISAPSNPVQVNFYCADASGNPTGALLGTYTMTSSINAGAFVTENYNLSVLAACTEGKIAAVISADNNCVCDSTSESVNITFSNLPPFDCADGLGYVITNNTSGGAQINYISGLNSFDLATSTTSLIDNQLVDAATHRFVNAIGYNVVDNYIYGIRQYTNEVVRIGSDGNIEILPTFGSVLNPAFRYESGDVSPDGILFVYSTDSGRMYSINLNPTAPDFLTPVQRTTIAPSFAFDDFSFSPINGMAYGVTRTTRRLFSFNPISNTFTNIGAISGLAAIDGGTYGTTFMDNLGNLYFANNNSGNTYKISVPHLATGGVTAALITSLNVVPGDGARCPNAPINPFANPDTFCSNVVMTILNNDVTGTYPLDISSVNLIDPITNMQSTSVTIAGQGTFTVNTVTGEINFTPLVSFTGTTINYVVADTQGNFSSPTLLTVVSNVTLVDLASTTCVAGGYTLSFTVNGLAPYIVTGTGAPGTWAGNTWTSGTIATGVNYNVDVQDANACNTLNVTGTAAACCTFTVTCPTFPITTIECYEDLPSQTSYTEAEFEALGNADGIIGNTPCGVIEINASNSANTGNCNQTITRTYVITEYDDTNNNGIRDLGEDIVLNTQNCIQTITVQDTTDPTFVEALPADATVECDAVPTAVTLTATDNCGTATVTFNETSTEVAGACANYTITRTWTATDLCGNDIVHTQTITVQDTTDPTFVEALPADATVECDAVPTAVTLTATDNCGTATVTFNETSTEVAGACANYTITRTWTATDLCGNDIVHTQTITVQDTTDPAFVEALPADATVECDAVPTAVTLTATDNCGTATVTFNETSTEVAGACANYTITRTWTATDLCGNDIVHTQTITVQDTTDPTFVEALPADATVECDAVPTAVTLTATDNCGTATVTFNETSTEVAGACANYTITRTWTATDLCGNDIIHTQTITVQDTTDPAFVEALPADATVECDAVPTAVTLTATDNCGTATVTFNETSTEVAGACANYTITRTWTATDLCGNDIIHTQTITVQDTTDPAFVEALPADATVECDAVPVAVTLTTTDNCGTATVTFNETSTEVAGACANYTITRTWTATDLCGNDIVHTQTITVQDTTDPAFVEALPADATVECDAVPVAVTLTATDNCGTATVTFNETSTEVAGACANYTITRTWTATDLCGNDIVHTQTITVQDTTDPAFVEALPANLVLECTDVVPAAVTLTATDNCGTATVAYDEQTINGSCPSNYQLIRTWTATDLCGNETTHIQMIDVQDTTPPVFTGDLPVDGFADCDNIPVAPTVTATDNCGNVTITLDEQRVDGDCSNRYELIRTWTATDDCNNSSTYVQTITLACHIEVFNALSPNGDYSNDVFTLEGIDCYPNNTVEIYNRWGVKVFETSNYDNINNAFKGYSDGRSTISRNEKLPTGTYFYILKYEYSYDGVNGKQNIEKAGYLYIQNN